MAESLKARQREILKKLMTSGIPLEVKFFEEEFQKSERTIRYDINLLKRVCSAYGVEIRYQTKKGFYIPVDQKIFCSEILMQEKYQAEPAMMAGSEEERYQILFLYLFLQKKRLPAEQIAEKLYISRSTLARMLAKFPDNFDGEVKVVSKKTGGYEIIGDELSLRKLASRSLDERLKGFHNNEEWHQALPEFLQEMVTLQRIQDISNSIKKVNARHNSWISNAAFLNLLSYCIVADIRSKHRKDMTAKGYARRGYGYELLAELLTNDQAISGNELEYLNIIMEENGILINIQEQDENRLRTALQDVIEMLKEVEINQNKRFDFDSLGRELFDHLKTLLHLWAAGQIQNEENYTVVREVKDNYHDFYELGAFCAQVLEEKLQVTFSDTETCYIAVYLYKNCHENDQHKKKVLVVCATGKGLSNLLTIRLKNVFSDLEVIGQISPYQFSNPEYYQKADFIISTIPLTDSKIPVIEISKILSYKDIVKIQEFLDYGDLADKIRVKQHDHQKTEIDPHEDPFTLLEDSGGCSRKDLACATNTLSKLILTLLEYTSKLPEKYKLKQDALLGLIIHMSMAVPRWYQDRSAQRSVDDSEEEYARIQVKHREVFEIMERFFTLVENSLMVSITIEEKIAFFVYIIKEDG